MLRELETDSKHELALTGTWGKGPSSAVPFDVSNKRNLPLKFTENRLTQPSLFLFYHLVVSATSFIPPYFVMTLFSVSVTLRPQ